ncbi:MAG: DUF4160 domain-containing protein [Bacteroidales bacterium]
MPTILRIKGFRFFFWSKEDGEPMHIHVEKADANAKIWLNPVQDAYFYGFTTKEIREIREIVNQNLELFKLKWKEYHEK